MPHAVETIPAGHPLQSSIEALYHRRGLAPAAVSTLRGALQRASLRPAPDAGPLPLGGPLYLVHATAAPAGDGVQIMAIVSWSDHGLPRMAAGLLDDAISAGVQVNFATDDPAEPAAEPAAPIERAPTRAAEPTAPERPAARRARPAKPDADSPHVDLSAEMALLEPSPAATPAPPAPAKPAAAPTGGGWAAAVAASKTPAAPAPSAGPPSPSDLGFDIDGDPDLERGDILLHPRFGRCKVIKPLDDKVKVRRPTGAFIDLHLKVCHFSRLPDEDGHRVFDVRIGRK